MYAPKNAKSEKRKLLRAEANFTLFTFLINCLHA